ncbi:DUF2225 domain-containing protein [Chloroflexi bacterium CFX2]|nr:DUF2225 domain-containing protein [Chloroflexi bacterium CFX2]
MKKNKNEQFGLGILIAVFFLNIFTTPVASAPLYQADPVTQCLEGVNLFNQGRDAEALPLLQSGFVARENAVFTSQIDLGKCALALGMLSKDRDSALDAYKVALDAFQKGGERWFEGITLNRIGAIYNSQGKYEDAIQSYEEALAIARELGDKTGEAMMLFNLGSVYKDQKNEETALTFYQQALILARELNDKFGEATILNATGEIYDEQGYKEEALEVYEQALSIRREINDRAGEGRTLDNISVVLIRMKRYSEALEKLNQALAIHQALGNREREGNTENSIGALYYELGEYDKALEHLQAALKIHKEVGNRLAEQNTLGLISEIYKQQALYPESIEYLQQALKINQETGNRPREAELLYIIGNYYYERRQYDDAFKYFQMSLPIMQEIADQSGESYVLNRIAAILNIKGDIEEALQYHQRSLALLTSGNDRAGIGTELNNIGGVYRSMGQYAKALDFHQQAFEIAKEIGDPIIEGDALNGMGVVYHAQGQYDEALDYYQQALKTLQKDDAPTSMGAVLLNTGLLYNQQGDTIKALEFYKQALDVYQDIGDQAHIGEALNGIGSIFLGQGNTSEALVYLNDAVDTARITGDKDTEAATLSNIGLVYTYQKKYSDALAVYDQALSIQQKFGYQSDIVTTLTNIAATYQEMGDNKKAIDYYEQSLEVLETLRSNTGSDSSRSAFMSKYFDIYDRTMNLYMQEGNFEKAFLVSERGRARAFLDALVTGKVQLSDNESTELLIREREAYVARQSARENLEWARLFSPETVDELTTTLSLAEDEYTDALKAIEDHGGQLNMLIPGRNKILELDEVQNLLSNQTTLISFWVQDTQTIVFILKTNSFKAITLSTSKSDLYELVNNFREFSNTEEAYPKSANQLYQALIEPIKENITTPNLIIVPHGVLHYLPFSAITDGTNYLMDDHLITYLPSTSAWPYIKQNTGKVNINPLIIGNPYVSSANLQPLPFAEKEAQTIADLYQAETFMNEFATESIVRDRAGESGVLHLAAHGNYNIANPLYSAIYLASDGKNDGILETHEIYGLNLHQTDLVVLSACETQLGKLSQGDELVGLTRAFIFAGTPSVISSLWSVDDQATKLLMEKFYVYWLSGMSKSEALRQAQIDVRELYPNPYYWAGFVLNGDGGQPTKINQPGETNKAETTPTETNADTNILIYSILAIILSIIVLAGVRYLISRSRKTI